MGMIIAGGESAVGWSFEGARMNGHFDVCG